MKFFGAILLLIRPIFGALASSRAHAAIDRIYDRISEKADAENVNAVPFKPISIPAESISAGLGAFQSLGDELIVKIVSYIRDPLFFGFSCKMFWNVVSGLAQQRILNQQRLTFPSKFDLALSGGELSVPAALKAYGNGALKVDPELLARNLELAFLSPAFRAAFNFQLWFQISRIPFFKELTEKLIVITIDSIHLNSPALEAHRRTLLHLLISLPEDSVLITKFFDEYPINLLAESSFYKFIDPISKRLSILPDSLLVDSVLPLFSFDQRLIGQLLNIFFQRSEHSKIRALLSVMTLDYTENYYLGCVSIKQFVKSAEMFLNKLDCEIIEIIEEINLKFPNTLSNMLRLLIDPNQNGPIKINELFHVAVLKTDLDLLNTFNNFDFSYKSKDSDFLSFLIKRDPIQASYLLNAIPKMASHKSFLLSSEFQSNHFGAFNNIPSIRVELKRTISCPEITRTHIIYVQTHQPHFFKFLLADTYNRISAYFTMGLKGHARKHYKEHPSFNIALTVLDVYYKWKLDGIIDKPEGFDPELILKEMLSELNILPEKPKDYFELAHELPSFSKAILAGGENEEESLILPEAPLNDIEILSETIALSQVIHDGSSINYRLVLQWFQQFGHQLPKIIPLHELKALLKGAAFHTIRSYEDKKRFDLDPQHQTDPFSMTYRYALIILVTQCKGIQSIVIKRLKSLFPGILSVEAPVDNVNNLEDSDAAEDDDNDSETEATAQVVNQLTAEQRQEFMDLVKDACQFYQYHTAFFSKFKIISTNSRAERFLLDFIRHFIKISNLKEAPIDLVLDRFFQFIGLNPNVESLLKDHFIYFTLLASFRRFSH